MKQNPLKSRGLWGVREWNRMKMYPSGWKHYAWVKKTLRRTFVSLWKNCFSPFGRKNNHFFLGKQKFASEFFCPWHKVSTQKEHIFWFNEKLAYCQPEYTRLEYTALWITSSHVGICLVTSIYMGSLTRGLYCYVKLLRLGCNLSYRLFLIRWIKKSHLFSLKFSLRLKENVMLTIYYTCFKK